MFMGLIIFYLVLLILCHVSQIIRPPGLPWSHHGPFGPSDGVSSGHTGDGCCNLVCQTTLPTCWPGPLSFLASRKSPKTWFVNSELYNLWQNSRWMTNVHWHKTWPLWEKSETELLKNGHKGWNTEELWVAKTLLSGWKWSCSDNLQ